MKEKQDVKPLQSKQEKTPNLNSFSSKEEMIKQGKKGTHLIERITLEKTPFEVIGQEREYNKGKVYFGVMGKHRLTEIYDNPETVEELLLRVTWERITQVVTILIEEREELLKIAGMEKAKAIEKAEKQISKAKA